MTLSMNEIGLVGSRRRLEGTRPPGFPAAGGRLDLSEAAAKEKAQSRLWTGTASIGFAARAARKLYLIEPEAEPRFNFAHWNGRRAAVQRAMVTNDRMAVTHGFQDQ